MDAPPSVASRSPHSLAHVRVRVRVHVCAKHAHVFTYFAVMLAPDGRLAMASGWCGLPPTSGVAECSLVALQAVGSAARGGKAHFAVGDMVEVSRREACRVWYDAREKVKVEVTCE